MFLEKGHPLEAKNTRTESVHDFRDKLVNSAT